MDKEEKTQYADVASWGLSDSMWERIAPLLPKAKSRFRGRGGKKRNIGGRPAAEPRQLMRGILYILRTGCQWNALPQEFGVSGKTAHRYFQRWVRGGVFKRMWQAGLNEYDELRGIVWKWQAADGSITKAPLGGEKTGKIRRIGEKRAQNVVCWSMNKACLWVWWSVEQTHQMESCWRKPF
jgi:transposase